MSRFAHLAWFVLALLPWVPAHAQVRTIDPNQAGAMAADRSIDPVPASSASAPASNAEPATPPRDASSTASPLSSRPAPVGGSTDGSRAAAADASKRGAYQDNDVLAAAEGVFGKGAEGLAKLVERILKQQGEPNAYIAGREVGGAVGLGLRYGSGTLFHKVEGQRPVYWQGPSLGFDLGANGAKTFVLVYNLYDSAELYHRFPAAEGNVYVVGGFTASYLRWKDVVIIPIRLGVGWRLGANVGYMRFTEKSRILPF